MRSRVNPATIAAAKALDKWYTKPPVARAVWALVEKHIPGKVLRRARFVEPSAGGGVFLNEAPKQFRGRIAAFDKAPDQGTDELSIRKRDFIAESSPECRGAVVIGNPPFGRNAELAMRFIARAFEQGAEVVAFVMPRCSRRRAAVEMLGEDLHCIVDENLERASFTMCGRSAQVWSCVQIWVRGNEGWKNKPALEDRGTETLTCDDFEISSYQRLVQTDRGQVKNPKQMPQFSFAVAKKAQHARPIRDRMAVKQARPNDWFLITAKDSNVDRRLERIDFGALAEHATSGCPSLSVQAVIGAYLNGFRPRPVLCVQSHSYATPTKPNRRAAGRRVTAQR